MTIKLFLKIAASLINRLYPTPEPPADPGHHVSSKQEKFSLIGAMRGLFGMGASIGSWFNVAEGPIFLWGCWEDLFPKENE